MSDKKSLVIIVVVGGAVMAVLADVFVAVYLGMVLIPPAQVILGLGAVALVGSVLLFWSSIRTLSGETVIEESNERENRGELEQKHQRKKMLLLALKDMDNERKLGKISEDDYEDVAKRYRDEIKALMREIDASADPWRAKAAALAKEHLRARGLDPDAPGAERADRTAASETGKIGETGAAANKAPTGDDANEPDVDTARSREKPDELTSATTDDPNISTKKSADHVSGAAKSARQTCEKCGESNEPDAKFCKGCATPMKKETGKTLASEGKQDAEKSADKDEAEGADA